MYIYSVSCSMSVYVYYLCVIFVYVECLCVMFMLIELLFLFSLSQAAASHKSSQRSQQYKILRMRSTRFVYCSVYYFAWLPISGMYIMAAIVLP